MRFTIAAVAMASGAAAGYYAPPPAYSAPPAYSTDYTTEMVTVTKCASTVTNCPAESTYVVPATSSVVYTTAAYTTVNCAGGEYCPPESTAVYTETVAVSTTLCPVTETEVPTQPTYAVPPVSTPGYYPPGPESTMVYVPPMSTGNYVPPTGSYVPPTGGYVPPPVSTPVYVPPGPATTEVCVPSSSVMAITKSYTTVITTVEHSTIQVPCATSGYEQPTGPVYTPPAYTAPPSPGNGTYPPPYTAGAASFGISGLAVVAGLAAMLL